MSEMKLQVICKCLLGPRIRNLRVSPSDFHSNGNDKLPCGRLRFPGSRTDLAAVRTCPRAELAEASCGLRTGAQMQGGRTH